MIAYDEGAAVYEVFIGEHQWIGAFDTYAEAKRAEAEAKRAEWLERGDVTHNQGGMTPPQ